MSNQNQSIQARSSLRLEFDNFLVKLAESAEELEAALRLRFEVFNLEMNEGLNTSWETGLDQDQYDEHADHLIVVDKRNQDKVVGTYRMLTKSRVIGNGGFYSEGEFDLTNLKKLPEEILEMGRSCVHKDYRASGVINLLWAGIAKFLDIIQAKYLFGCGSLHTHDVQEISEIYSYLKANHLAGEEFRVYPVAKCVVAGLRDDLPVYDRREVMKKMPPLLKGYFRIGASICGAPALDAEFGTTDFCILLPTAQINSRYQRHYQTGQEQS
ncbi:MAG: GNAT family N-acetyltransferase [candidate division KSB1 bacterium]|nr:GNAT family N-acetyltransferase [candidate division KSB1 bacterium]MDZ7317819.1 GNAT family N-acetyltransferase [candidate division KSB1 bacterium]MDZ7341904.1 GNAT family N-acetyltransferase [candidate division KSB1 bacterium]